MSLMVEKFLGGGTPKVRTYKRSTDEVDLNDYIRLAEAGFDNWLSNVSLKDKEKQAVRSAYVDMLGKINEDPQGFAAKIGGGFNNNYGIHNAQKGFDAYGIAANYLGTVLRSMDAYTDPNKKAVYNRNLVLLTPAMQKQIFGNNPDNFIALDAEDPETGTRGTANRVALTIRGLEALKGNLSNYYSFDTDEDRLYAELAIDNTIAALRDNDINNDYFNLDKLGVSSASALFNTEGTPKVENPSLLEAPLLTSEQQAQIKQAERAKNLQEAFTSFVSANYPNYTGNLATINLDYSLATPVNTLVEQALVKGLNNKNNTFLKLFFQYLITKGTTDLKATVNLWMSQIFPGAQLSSYLTRAYILSKVLNQMNKNGLWHDQGDGTYYIEGSRSQKNGGYTGWILNTNNKTLQLLSLHDILYWKDKIIKEFQSQYDTDYWIKTKYAPLFEKQGGILKYYGGGGVGRSSTNPYWYDDIFSSYVDDLLSSATNASNKLAFANSINNTLHTHSQLKSNWTGGNSVYVGENNNVRNYLREINDNYSYVNTKGITNAKSKNRYTYVNKPTSGDNSNLNWNPDNKYSSQTDDRRVLGREGDFTEDQLSNITSRFNTAGYEMYLDDEDRYYKLRIPTALVTTRSSDTDPTQDTSPTSGEDASSSAKTTTRSTPVTVNETGWKSRIDEILKSKQFNPYEYIPLATDLASYTKSLATNKANYKDLAAAQVPKLHNTWGAYAPVTGAFSTKLLYNSLGADVMRASYQPFTSDAYLAANRMLLGQLANNQALQQGNQIDDAEIKRTALVAQQLSREWAQRRSDIANYNTDAIISNNLALALLKAARRNSDYKSFDALMKGVGTWATSKSQDWATKKAEEEAYKLQQAQAFTLRKYLNELDEMTLMKKSWQITHPNESIYSTTWYPQMLARAKEISSRMANDNNMFYGKIKGYPYLDLYGSSTYLPKSWLYILSEKNGGKLNKLITKVIRDNENNS